MMGETKNIKFVIWGAGIRGHRLLKLLGENMVDAIIDTNVDLQGEYIDNIPIISYENYEEKFNNNFIIISSLLAEDEIINFLINKRNYKFFPLTDNPQEITGLFGDIFNNLPFSYDKTMKSYVYGTNLFGVILFIKLLKEGLDVFLVPPPESAVEKNVELKKGFGDRFLPSIDNNSEANIFYTVHINKEIFNKPKYKVYDCSDFSYQIKKYNHPELAVFKNVYQGERCFIVATGPSLRISDLNILYTKGEISFSMNKIFKCFDQTKWRPNYYFVSDDLVFRQNIKEINNIDVLNVFITDVAIEDEIVNHRFYRYHHDLSSYKYIDYSFSNDITKITFTYGSVLHIIIQFVVYMGFKEIYLLGTDFNKNMLNTHFYAQKQVKTYVSDRKAVYAGYIAAKKYADSHGIKIFNATRGGELEVFPRVDFDSLFKK